jgi:hypothetical protein
MSEETFEEFLAKQERLQNTLGHLAIEHGTDGFIKGLIGLGHSAITTLERSEMKREAFAWHKFVEACFDLRSRLETAAKARG